MELTKINQSLENLNNNHIQLAYELEQLNEIYAPFRLSDEDIARWVIRINNLKPEITPEIMNEIVLNFISGKFKYDKNIGIANIFNAYSKIKTNGMVW